MKKLTLILLSLCSIAQLNSQKIQLMLIPFEKEGKWGYVDYNDSLVVEPIFEEAYPTYNLRGRIKLNGKYGFIDENGEMSIKPKYNVAEDFRFGIAKVSKNGKTKYIKTNGKENKL